MPLSWLSFSGFALLLFRGCFVSSGLELSEDLTLLACKEIAIFFQKFPFVFSPVFQIPLADDQGLSHPKQHGVLRGKVICICMGKLMVWRYLLTLIDFLSLFHVQMICYITAINIDNLLAEKHGTKS